MGALGVGDDLEPWGVALRRQRLFNNSARRGRQVGPDFPKLPSVASGDDEGGVLGFFCLLNLTFWYSRRPRKHDLRRRRRRRRRLLLFESLRIDPLLDGPRPLVGELVSTARVSSAAVFIYKEKASLFLGAFAEGCKLTKAKG